MKSLSEYITEVMNVKHISTKDYTKMLKAIFGDNIKEAIAKAEKFFPNARKFKERNIHKTFSINNKADRAVLLKNLGYAAGYDNAEVFALAISGVLDAFNAELYCEKDKPFIVETKSKAGYDAFQDTKESGDYLEFEDYDPDADYSDNESGRAFVIYYQYDPSDISLVKVYRMDGKTTTNLNQKLIRAHRYEWHLITNLGYYHANNCTVDYYRKTDKAELSKVIDLDDDTKLNEGLDDCKCCIPCELIDKAKKAIAMRNDESIDEGEAVQAMENALLAIIEACDEYKNKNNIKESLKDDYKEIEVYWRDNIDDFEARYQVALNRMDRDRAPLYNVMPDLYDEMQDALNDWCDDNDKDPDDYEIEEITFA